MSAREAILGRLKSAPGGNIASEAAALLIAPERPAIDTTDLDATFVAKLSLPSVAATHDRIGALAELPAAIARYLDEQGLDRRLYLPPDALLDGCDWSALARDNGPAPDQPAALAIARAGIAETGTLVFETGPEAPMLPNFLALHHIVLVRADTIVGHLEEALPHGAPPRAYYWVTGVSGTTDIEGTYIRGAHGPRFLHVILLD